MTCCRASHPEEVESFVAQLATLRAEERVGERTFPVAYQVTIALGDTKQEALASQREYIDAYYPGFSDAVALDDWGRPAPGRGRRLGSIVRSRGCHSVCLLASLDQPGQLERMARDVMPAARQR